MNSVSEYGVRGRFDDSSPHHDGLRACDIWHEWASVSSGLFDICAISFEISSAYIISSAGKNDSLTAGSDILAIETILFDLGESSNLDFKAMLIESLTMILLFRK